MQSESGSEASGTSHSEPEAPTDVDPVHGVGYAFVPEGENLWVYSWFEPSAKLPEHYHPRQEERWEVLEGSARVQVGSEFKSVVPGDGPQVVAPGVKHSLENVSGVPIRLRCEVIPAYGLQDFLTDSASAAREGLIRRGGIPSGLKGARWAATFLKRHREDTVMTFPPRFAQSAMIALFARD